MIFSRRRISHAPIVLKRWTKWVKRSSSRMDGVSATQLLLTLRRFRSVDMTFNMTTHPFLPKTMNLFQIKSLSTNVMQSNENRPQIQGVRLDDRVLKFDFEVCVSKNFFGRSSSTFRNATWKLFEGFRQSVVQRQEA